MNKSLLIVSSLIVAAPLAWAQSPGKAVPATPAMPAAPAAPGTPATPAVPATPATPATPADPARKPEAKGMKQEFASIDANADGKLSRDEVSAHASLDFNALDRNGDGTVTRGEFESGTRAKKPG